MRTQRTDKAVQAISKRPHNRGFTLVEATAAILIALAIAGIGLALVIQQVWFQQTIADQRFIAEDGPTTCNLLSRTMNKTDRFLIYASADDAKNETTPVLENGEAVVLSFLNPDPRTRSLTMIAKEEVDGQTVLNFYHATGANGADPVWGSDPSWTISRNIQDIDFSVDDGVLRAVLTGPNGGVIRLGGSSQL